MGWAEPFRRMGVRANADIPRDALQARAFGAEGIGLCRTEHMFFAEDRLPHMRAMILANNEKIAAPRCASCCLISATILSHLRSWTDFGNDPHPRSTAARIPAPARRTDGRHRQT